MQRVFWESAAGRMTPHDFGAVHWEHEPLAVPRPKESADKSDALQTLRAVRRRPAVAKRLERVRLQRRFPKPSYDSMTRPVTPDKGKVEGSNLPGGPITFEPRKRDQLSEGDSEKAEPPYVGCHDSPDTSHVSPYGC